MDDWIETKIPGIDCPWSDATQTPRPSSCDFRSIFNFDFFKPSFHPSALCNLTGPSLQGAPAGKTSGDESKGNSLLLNI